MQADQLATAGGVSVERRLSTSTNVAHSGVSMDPRLREWMAEQMRGEAVLKERRKAREQRLLSPGSPHAARRDVNTSGGNRYTPPCSRLLGKSLVRPVPISNTSPGVCLET